MLCLIRAEQITFSFIKSETTENPQSLCLFKMTNILFTFKVLTFDSNLKLPQKKKEQGQSSLKRPKDQRRKWKKRNYMRRRIDQRRSIDKWTDAIKGWVKGQEISNLDTDPPSGNLIRQKILLSCQKHVQQKTDIRSDIYLSILSSNPLFSFLLITF